MRARLALLALLACAVLPARAAAKAIEDVKLAADASDLVVTVFSDEPLRTPTVRTYAGLVRVRFYDASVPSSSKLEGDGSALRTVELGRGSDRTAALTLTLGDRTKLAPADVRVENQGEVITLRVARGLLPPLAQGSALAQLAAAKPATPPASAQKTAPPAQPAAAPTTPPAAAVQAPKEPPRAPLGKPKAAPAAEQAEEKLTGGGTSTLPMLLGATLLLGLAYLGLQLFLRKKGPQLDIPAIEVVAQKRLAPRHQLVIVRAFDRDYLLSIQGGQTTVIARSSRRREASGDEPALVRGLDVSKPARDFEDDEVTFGGELFKQALEQRERAREQSVGAAERVREQQLLAERARAEARELERLEVDRGFESDDGRILGNDLGRPRARSANPERRPTSDRALADALSGLDGDLGRGVDPSNTQGMSESVSGLLRLRKKAGK